MRVDPDACTDPDILAAEVRRLQAVIAASDTLTDAEREAIEAAVAYMRPVGNYDCVTFSTLRGLLERTR
jgi:hypothetical protein